jgi:Gti1/Pac2 family transcription factor
METYHGHVKTPSDAIILFEACRIGLLPRVQRRLSEKERQQIKSGSVFVWDEREAGMRRWTDGKSWSASRVSGSFLTYREMEGKRGGNGLTPPAQTPRPSVKYCGKKPKEDESDEDGPDGYRYKPDGLMKQSFSITTSSGQHLHLISYYARSSPTATELQQPSNDPALRHIRPPKNMYPESTVNESSSTPPVTRGPMGGSPYAQAVHPMGSPYTRPGVPPGYALVPTSWPPTPSATPPYAIAYYPHPGHPHSPLHYPHVAYPPPGYPHGHPPPGFERGAPIPNGLPPPSAHVPNGHVGTPYPPNPAAHTQSPPVTHAPAHPAQTYPPSQYRDNRNVASAAAAAAPPPPPTVEQPTGPTLAPFTSGTQPSQGTNGNNEKQPSPNPGAVRTTSSDTLQVAEQQTTSAPSPARMVPSVGALLNAHPNEETKSDKGGSRQASRSPPTAIPRHAQDIPQHKIGQTSGADYQALRKLDSTFIHNVHVSS